MEMHRDRTDRRETERHPVARAEEDDLHHLISSLDEHQRRQVRAYIERLKLGQIRYSGPQNGLYTGEFPDRIGGFVQDP
ncbi:hypothetical protein [Alicyclobacillus macrosporangiidus]|uniref:Uncharacterized protein n=1 Tax=Alicyclobacillus macrosporangiidus TaxID=392015 RepID=A0A1I7HDV4_9BACL|nr:hypothetical protein [Alicyclobacillus macrosporangiidus]SFU58883.1 hypothetical protein SAMN05421543_104140 [Alicyclobacillus macrosporangiidus]